MSQSIAILVRDSLAGRHAQSAAACAALRAKDGSQPQAAISLASQAASRGDPRLLGLAFALWPEAQGMAAGSFLGALSLGAAKFCLSRSDALRAFALAELRKDHARAAGAAHSVKAATVLTIAATESRQAKELAEGLLARRKAAGLMPALTPAAAAPTKPEIIRRQRIAPKLDIGQLRERLAGPGK